MERNAALLFMLIYPRSIKTASHDVVTSNIFFSREKKKKIFLLTITK